MLWKNQKEEPTEKTHQVKEGFVCRKCFQKKMALEQLLKCEKVSVQQERGKTVLPKRTSTLASDKEKRTREKKKKKHGNVK